ncbi:MAG TPA: histidine phosphatase family protein [Candidatus Dormibacteraeota bacterium]|nr:histidine phosphatase family protein [Candidatus Dormibacteraeota bacterium]
MELYILRHGDAGERDPARWPDDAQRPLSREGRMRMERAGKAFRRLGLRFDVALSSPYVRALETAQAALPRATILKTESLTPGADPDRVLEELATLDGDAVIIVSHEPLCGLLVARSAAPNGLRLRFGKGALCRIDLSRPQAGAGTLRWVIPARAWDEIG